MSNLKKWLVLASTMVVDHPWCRVRRDRIALPNGQVIDDFFLSLRPDVAMVLPITATGEVVFVRQYRHGAGEILLELPAGGINLELESPACAALRELQEETGYTADSLRPLTMLRDNPVKDTNQIHLFLARPVYPWGAPKLDITEDIEVVLIPIAEIPDRIRSGEICVAGTVAALF